MADLQKAWDLIATDRGAWEMFDRLTAAARRAAEATERAMGSASEGESAN